jgi:ankyrin repeat protein
MEDNTEKILELINEKNMDKSNPKNKLTPMHYAAMNANKIVIEYLIQLKANMNSLDQENRTPLYYSIMRSKYEIEIINLMLDKKSDPFCGSSTNNSYIKLLKKKEMNEKDFVSIVEKIHASFKVKFVNTKKQKNYLHLLCENKPFNHDMILFLINKKININEKDNHEKTPIYYACANKNINNSKKKIISFFYLSYI